MIYLIGNPETEGYLEAKVLLELANVTPHEIALREPMYPGVRAAMIVDGNLYVGDQIGKAIAYSKLIGKALA